MLARQAAPMVAQAVPLIPLFILYNWQSLTNGYYWGDQSNQSGIFNTQALVQPQMWYDALWVMKPTSALSTSSSGSTNSGSSTSQVSTTMTASSSTTSTSSSQPYLYAGIAAIVVIVVAAGAVLAMRRGRGTGGTSGTSPQASS